MRRQAFKLLDLLRGSPLEKHLSEINSLMNSVDYEVLQERQRPVLQRLLRTVSDKSPYYFQYKGCTRLSDFPVQNKFDIKENFSLLNIPLSKNQKVLVSSSGSTGTPFRIYQSTSKRMRNTADTIYFARKAGFEVGHKLMYLRFWAAYYKKPRWITFFQNIEQIDVEELTEDYLAAFLRKLQADPVPKGWLGYPSGFDKIIRYCEKQQMSPLECNFKSIIGMSEYFPERTRVKMSYYFNCPAVSRYSNVENGIIAQQRPGEKSFDINWASYIVELLELDTNEAAKPGDPGRIVITDLFNYATPMIRYDTGDIGVFEVLDRGLPQFKSIQGRKSDILTNTKGELISPFIFHASLEEYQELQQVQVVQDGHKYTFRIKAEQSPFKREKSFIDSYTPFFGKGARVYIEYIDETPNLNSGKRRLTINLTNSK